MCAKQIAIIGGGAAGFFAAINCASVHPDYSITIYEKSPKLLSKVKVSGGGRCNVTHACTDARQLVKFYPRGEKQLLGPFSRFGVSDVIEWFGNRGVQLKTEEDGRMFPVTDSSQTIIDCFLDEARAQGIKVITGAGIKSIQPDAVAHKWCLVTDNGNIVDADAVLVAAGSSERIWKMMRDLGHNIVPPVPSLFTFNIKSNFLSGLEGLSVEKGTVTIAGNAKLSSTGPLLLTHWGLSGPAVLKLSAWGARYLAGIHHRFEILVNWAGPGTNDAMNVLKQFKTEHPKKTVSTNPLFGLPKRLWERITGGVIGNFADLSNKQIESLAGMLTAMPFAVNGKSTFKDEFVTAGGVDLNEVDFKTMQSKRLPGLYFAGEVLDIDAVTGGFNFQAAWTTGWIAGNSI